MRIRIVLVAVMLSSLFPAMSLSWAAETHPITVKIVNNSGVDASKVWVLLTANDPHTIVAEGITAGKSTQLSTLKDNQFTLTSISAGLVYFSFNGAVPANQQPVVPSARFDKVEVTYPGAADLTAVDFFGIPFRLETLDASGNVLQKLTYYASKNTLTARLLSLAPNALVKTSTGSFARVLAPVYKASAYPSMQKYVKSVFGQKVTIAGTYTGKVGPNPNTYNYSGTFNRTDGTITLTGTMSAIPKSLPITVQGSTLPSAIYTNNGVYTVGGKKQQVSANDVYAAIYRDMIAGFDFGYMGGRYGWNSASWYGTTPYNPPYAGARKTNDGYFNQYASIISASSDAYGFPFMDLNQKVQVDLNSGAVANVATLRITILPDNMLDSPVIKSVSSNENSIAMSWTPVTGATGYTVQVSPPLGSEPINTGSKTSCTIQKLNPGTPYTVSITASNGAATSEAIPVVISTKGHPTPVQGEAKWNFVLFFTGSFPNHTITFNGTSKTLPSGPNPSIAFNNVGGQPGRQNAYVFKWTDSKGILIFNTVLYVTLDDMAHHGKILQDQRKTFMASNQRPPTYDGTGSNLYLSIAPSIQRTAVSSNGLPDLEPTQFGPMPSVEIGEQKHVHLMGTVVDGDDVRSVAVAVTTSDGRTEVYPAIMEGTNWKAMVNTFGSRRLQVVVTATDEKANFKKKAYVVDLSKSE